MKFKSKIFSSDWWTERSNLLLRKEENLEEKPLWVHTPAKLVFILGLLLIPAFLLGGWLGRTLFPRVVLASKTSTQNNLKRLYFQVDSLTDEVEAQYLYIENIKNLLGGDVQYMQAENSGSLLSADTIPSSSSANSRVEETFSDSVVDIDRLDQADIRLREEMAKRDMKLNPALGEDGANPLRNIHLFAPLRGIVSGKYEVEENHLGLDIVAAKDAPIKSVAEGTVIMATWTDDTGYVISVQHSGGLISVYKHCSRLLKKTGEAVRTGEIIAIIGNTGKFTSGPHLHLELWYRGYSLNPEYFISF